MRTPETQKAYRVIYDRFLAAYPTAADSPEAYIAAMTQYLATIPNSATQRKKFFALRTMGRERFPQIEFAACNITSSLPIANNILTPVQVRHLLSYLSEPFYTAGMLVYGAFFHLSEVVHLEKSHVQLSKNLCHVPKLNSRTCARTVSLPRSVLPQMRELVKNANPYLFHPANNSRRYSPHTIMLRLKEAADAAKITDFSATVLRDSGIVHALRQNATSVGKIREFAGYHYANVFMSRYAKYIGDTPVSPADQLIASAGGAS